MALPRRYQVWKEVALPRAAVWNVLSHTERLNRRVGLSPVSYGDLQIESSGFFRPARAKVAGFDLRWREYPFEWEIEHRHTVVRVYEKGPIERFEGGIELEDAGLNRTKICVFADISARGASGAAVVPILARQFLGQTLRFCDDVFNGQTNPQPRAPQPARRDVNGPLLERLTLELGSRAVPVRYATALQTFLREAGDDEVTDLRPYEWADHAKIERHEALRTCLHAVKCGLLNLRWTAMCPNCRVAKTETSSLKTLGDNVHCDLCGVFYDLNFDRYVELRFAVHPAVRKATHDVYCIAGPFRTRHILKQQKIGAYESAVLPIPRANTELRVRVLRSNHRLNLVENRDADAVCEPPTLVLRPEGWSDGQKPLNSAASVAGGAFRLENKTREAVVVVLEKTQWDEQAVSAAQVTALQEFRDLFSSEILRPGRQIAVENLVLFFSDLSNSTALYERIGDAPAFGRVGRHFDFLSEHIRECGGAVVKTMGDAVMAVFYRKEEAARAAMRVQTEFPAFRAAMSDLENVDIKIGLHFGPALAVNSNERLDYFGRTVNIAARIVSLSEGGEIMLTQELWNDEATREAVCAASPHVSKFRANLRGMDEHFDLVRVRI